VFYLVALLFSAEGPATDGNDIFAGRPVLNGNAAFGVNPVDRNGAGGTSNDAGELPVRQRWGPARAVNQRAPLKYHVKIKKDQR